MTIKIIRLKDYSTQEITQDKWNSALLKSTHNNPFLTWEWLYTWWDHFKRGELLILMVKENDEISAIAPLVLLKRKFRFIEFNVVQLMGTGLSDYGDFILIRNKEKCASLFLDFIQQNIKWDFLDLRNIPEDSDTPGLLLKIAKEKKYLVTVQKTICRWIPLPSTWEEYFNSLSSNMRKQLRQNLRHVSKRYSIELIHAKNLDNSVNMFFDTYSKWLTERYAQSSLFGVSLSDIKKFLIDFTMKSFEKGWVSLSFISLNQEPVSSYYGFIYGDCFYLYMTSWNPQYSYYGVGSIHMMSLIKYSIEHGLRKFDLLRGDEQYKVRWNSLKKNNMRILIFKRNIKGRILYYLFKMMSQPKMRKFLMFIGIKEL